jgi:hypothetical protein
MRSVPAVPAKPARSSQPEQSGGDDPFAQYDAAYVLGALSPADRDAFATHLRSCDACSAAVAELAGMPGLLGRVPLDVAEGADDTMSVPLPPSILPRLVREVERARRRRLVGSGVMALAACLLAVTAVLWHLGTQPATAPTVAAGPEITLQAVQTSPVAATADFTSVAWGTKIGLHCTYEKDPGTGYTGTGVYSLVVKDKSGNSGQAATWLAVPGRALTITAATSVNAADIAAIEIHAADGSTLLRATP